MQDVNRVTWTHVNVITPLCCFLKNLSLLLSGFLFHLDSYHIRTLSFPRATQFDAISYERSYLYIDCNNQ